MTPRPSPNKTLRAPQPFDACRGMAANSLSQCAEGSGERRLRMRGLIAVSVMLLNACAHHALGCAFGRYYDDCLPGTTAYEEHNARAIAADRYDDALCRSEGLPSGSSAYTECRVNRANELDPDTRAAISAMSKFRGDQLQLEAPAEDSRP
jgi:hypothetical protein